MVYILCLILSWSTRKRKNQAGVEKLEKEGDVKVDREDKKVFVKLQLGANAETMLLCQHRKRTSVAQAHCSLVFQQHHFSHNLSLIQMCFNLQRALEKMFLC